MFALSTLVVTALAALALGGVIGAVLVKSLTPQEQQKRSLENHLQKAEEDLKDYQQEVSEHFAETSQLVNNLTQSYKDVHEFMANSALKLTNPAISRQLIEASVGKLADVSSTTTTEDDQLEAPRDWAPKVPGDKGQLSEDFGLDKQQTTTDDKLAS